MHAILHILIQQKEVFSIETFHNELFLKELIICIFINISSSCYLYSKVKSLKEIDMYKLPKPTKQQRAFIFAVYSGENHTEFSI